MPPVGTLSDYEVNMVNYGEWSLSCHDNDGANVSAEACGVRTCCGISFCLPETKVFLRRLHESLQWNHVEYCNTIFEKYSTLTNIHPQL